MKNQTTDKAKLESKLSKWRAILDTKKNEIMGNWEKYENFYLGSHWNNTSAKAAHSEYNSNGTLIVVREFDNDMKSSMPKRTINKIFPMIQTELAILSNLNPTIQTFPMNKKYSETARKLNLFNRHVFGDGFTNVYDKTCFFALQFGHGFFKIAIKKVDDRQVPFKIIYVDPKDIQADPNANEWSEVKCVVRKVKQYAYELKQKYIIDLQDVDDLKVVEIEEQCIKESGMWKLYYIYNGKILDVKNKDEETGDTEFIEKDYPVNLYELFKFYGRNKGWWGISEISNVLEYQIQINKRASQHDYHLNYLIDPAVNVTGGAIDPTELAKLPLEAGQYYQSKGNGSISPIIVSAVNDGQFFNSIQSSVSNLEEMSGVTKSAQGVNEKGVYSAKHFKAIQDSTMSRFKLKEKSLKDSLKNVAEKVYILARDYLGQSGTFEIFDYENDTMTTLTADDFDLDRMRIDIEVVGANLLDPTSRLERLIEFKQYAPDIPSAELIISADEQYKGLFNADHVKSLKTQSVKQREIAELNLEMQKAQLEAQINQIKNPPAPPIDPNAQQQMPPQAMPQEQPQQEIPPEQMESPQEPQALPQEMIVKAMDKIFNDGVKYMIGNGIKDIDANKFMSDNMKAIMESGNNNLDEITAILKDQMDKFIGGQNG
jgi:hypothetical protein